MKQNKANSDFLDWIINGPFYDQTIITQSC